MKTKEKTTPVKAKKKGKKALKVLCIILAVILILGLISAAATAIGNKGNLEKITGFDAVTKENVLVPEKDDNGYWTFTTDEEFKVLHLTDVHIGGGWLSLKKDAMALNAVAAMVTAEKPDLVVVTGDISFPVPYQAGTLNNLNSAEIFAALMDKLGVYWTVTLGNHDTESYSYFSRKYISDFYSEKAGSYCLFQSGPEEVDGYGNQVINIKNTDGIITQTLFLMDSHSYVDGDVLGIMWKYDNIHENQVQWYKETVLSLNEENNAKYKELGIDKESDIKSTAFMHIPLTEMKDAWDKFAENGYENSDEVTLHYGVAGESGDVVYCGIHEDDLFETMVELGSTKGVFCGHDHENNFSIEYEGIRMTYGMSIDYLAYAGIYKRGAQRGCTLITFSPDGTFDCKAENYYQDKYESVYTKEEVEMQTVTYATTEN